MKLSIYGCGGFGREVASYVLYLKPLLYDEIEFIVDDEFWKESTDVLVPTKRRSEYIPEISDMFIAIGNPLARRNIVESFDSKINYPNLIFGDSFRKNSVGEGTIICPNSIITTGVKIGKHCHINIGATIGHDCMIGNFVTISPAVNISGNVKIGNNVFIGTNACIKEGITICNNAIIGMGSVVVKDITESGTYVGNPLRKIK